MRLATPHTSPALPVPLGPPLEIVHSPLARTTETARLVADAAAASEAFARPIPLRPDPRFKEIGQGEWEGLPGTEISERWGDVLAAWRRTPVEAHAPGGESLPEVRDRVRTGLADLLARLAHGAPRSAPEQSQVLGYADATVRQPWSILVAHDGLFKVALLTLFELPLERFWTFPFALCGISVVEVRGGRPTLRAHNLTEHLAPLLEERAQAVSEERERAGAL